MMKTEMTKYLQNPTCNCSLDFLVSLLKNCRPQLAEYFPDKDIATAEEVSRQAWEPTVINCSVDDLEARLKALPPGRKQVSVARYMDQVTVVINELDLGD